MTEHVHEWNWFKYDGHYHCQVSGCDERCHPIKMEPNVNATERLSRKDIVNIGGRTFFTDDNGKDTEYVAIDANAWKAYADILEGK